MYPLVFFQINYLAYNINGDVCVSTIRYINIDSLTFIRATFRRTAQEISFLLNSISLLSESSVLHDKHI